MNRREFLEAAGLTAAALAIPGCRVNSSQWLAGELDERLLLPDDNKAIDVKINVKPISSNRIHLKAYEGPCRTGEMDRLTTEFEINKAKKKYAGFVKDIEKNLSKDAVMLEPVSLRLDHDKKWKGDIIFPREWKKLKSDLSEVDLFLISYRVPGIEKYKKPVAMIANGIVNVDISAYLRSEGVEGYAPYDWGELNELISLMRVRKAVSKTKVLVVTERNACRPHGVYSICDLDELKERYGIGHKYVSYKEFFGEMEKIAESSSGQQLAEEVTDKLIGNAQKTHMEREYVLSSVNFYLATKSLMSKYGCNAFTVECFELCASQIPAEVKITPCLTHTLLKDHGYPSACEGDTNVLLAMMLEMYASKKSIYMGNPTFNRKENIVTITHDVPGLRMKGLEGGDLPYEIRNFTTEGWGATVRYDFSKDVGEEVTLVRFNPQATKLLVTKGKIVKDNPANPEWLKGGGFSKAGCVLNVSVKIPNAIEVFHEQANFGHHFAMVYGDYTKQLRKLSEMMKFEVVEVL